ncbi:MAG: acyl carrier protein [Oscillospiraceae bacterium]|nr:acyl carrier protein [Oscillospiraceae bacterium]
MVIDKVIAILCEQFELDENDITEDTSLVDDLGADSMDSLDITMALEEEFDIEIPDEEAEELRTVRDIVNYIENNI